MKHQWKPLLLVAYVFIFTGSIICMNDVLLPTLRDFFQLSYVQASFVQQSFYLVYLIFPIPIAFYISRFGYKTGIITALLICAGGASFFIPAYYFSSYILALCALFVISLGVTLVNVAANPLAALLGHPSGAHIRVNFVQLFSRIGYSITPVFATQLIYSGTEVNFHFPYVILGVGTIVLATIIVFSRLPSLKPEMLKGFTLFSILKDARRHPQLVWGAVTMFFYMGAEACTAGFYISYLRDVAGFDADRAATYLSYYYIASTIFCLIGIYLLQLISAGKLIAIFGCAMVALYLLAVFTHTSLNPYYMIALGAFISVMFPCIFSLGIEGLGSFTEKGSALINIAVVGGAVFPPLQGLLADSYGVQVSYVIPCFSFLMIISYGVYCARNYKSGV